MNIKFSAVRLMAATVVAAALVGCESSQPTTVGLYKSEGQPASYANGQNADAWRNRGMTPPSTQLQ
jgi:hypothetical protein